MIRPDTLAALILHRLCATESTKPPMHLLGRPVEPTGAKAMRLMGLGGNRRKALRRAGSSSVAIFVEDARVGDAQIVDMSQTGAKLTWRQRTGFPAAGVIFDRRTSQVMSFRRVWQRGDQAGVHFRRTQDIRGLVAPEFQRIKAALRTSAPS